MTTDVGGGGVGVGEGGGGCIKERVNQNSSLK